MDSNVTKVTPKRETQKQFNIKSPPMSSYAKIKAIKVAKN